MNLFSIKILKLTLHRFIFLVWLLSAQHLLSAQPSQPIAPEQAYGELFEQVQLQAVFPDSKTFVDCLPKAPIDEIMARFNQQKSKRNFDLKKFVDKYFELPPQPSSGYQSDASRNIVEHINALWPVLTRQPDGASGSLIPLPNPYVVPGGRFGEVYYWDSYFTMLGLQVSGKTELIEDMVDNFSHLINTIGFIPNGNRTYYRGRSQPPFYALMVQLLAEEKGDDILKKYLSYLEKEYNFWMAGSENLSSSGEAFRRVVRMPNGTILNRYWDDFAEPRPESYKEDYRLAQEAGRPPEELYRDIRAAAESGWDFSARWFADGTIMASIQTTKIIPVDLNALLYNLEKTIAEAHRVAGNTDKSLVFEAKARARKTSIIQYCYNLEKGYYTDYLFVENKSSDMVTMAGVFPLFFGIATQDEAGKIAKVLEENLLKDGGFLTTSIESEQQWDAPNGWAPLQWMAYAGLKNYGFNELASKAAERWIDLNEKVYESTGKMVEKYIVTGTSDEAGGGEYPLQDGFGWSNGVLLKLMEAEGRLD